jgi:tRNA-Thr(GGU) m(6)t(6)A37 methyltransferase TsaA
MSCEIQFIGIVEKVLGDESVIRIYHQYVEGLEKINEYPRLWVLYWFHERDNAQHRNTLRVIPHRHGCTEYRGVFASHSPSRPNPIGLTAVDLIKKDENCLIVRGLDAFKDSPIIDLKPLTFNPKLVNLCS